MILNNHISCINLHRPLVSGVTELDGASKGVIVVRLGAVDLFFENSIDLQAFATRLLAEALELDSRDPAVA